MTEFSILVCIICVFIINIYPALMKIQGCLMQSLLNTEGAVRAEGGGEKGSAWFIKKRSVNVHREPERQSCLLTDVLT